MSYLSSLLDRQRGRSGGGESLKRFLRIKMIILGGGEDGNVVNECFDGVEDDGDVGEGDDGQIC